MNQSVTKNRLTGEQIQKITEKIFDTGNCLANYEELTDGFCNTAYRLTLSDGKRAVLKVAPKKGITMMSCEKGMMQTEVAAMKLAREQGISGVPEVYGYDDSYELCDSIYFVMESLDGESYAAVRGNMSEKEQAEVNVQTGEYLAGLNRIKGKKFGHFWMKELQWYDIYLYLIMMFEGTYRHYETNEQYLWVHSLFVPIWEELKKKE